MTYFLSVTLVSVISFLNRISKDLDTWLSCAFYYLLEIVHHIPWPILKIWHELSFSHIGFQFQAHFWMAPARIFMLGTLMHSITTLLEIAHWWPWPIFDLGHDLLSISCIGFCNLISEWNQLGSWYLAHWCSLWLPCSWMEPARILILGTLMHPLTTFFLNGTS